VGEWFPIFSSEGTEIRLPGEEAEYPDVPRLSSTVLLDSAGVLLRLPVGFTCLPAWKTRAQAFTPFAPRLGYHVTCEDGEPAARVAKLQRWEWRVDPAT
jgi:hypothetical protein